MGSQKTGRLKSQKEENRNRAKLLYSHSVLDCDDVILSMRPWCINDANCNIVYDSLNNILVISFPIVCSLQFRQHM